MNSYRRLFLIFVHVLLWSVLIIIPKFVMPAGISISMRNEFLLWVPIIISFYLNYFILVPLLLTRKKFLLYTFSITTILLVTMSLGIFSQPPPGFQESKMNMPPPKQRPDKFKGDIFIPFMGLRNITSCFLFLAIGTSIRVTEQWYSNEKLRKEMENQKLTAELSFLKSQINPHFFFNTLNSIYSLANSKSEKTPEAIIKLSELMRFIIYDSEKEFVPLKREIEYIKNYVELQKLRLMPNIKVNYSIIGEPENIDIEPLILLPFIENAFKHGIDATKECIINIEIKISSRIKLIVENPVVKSITVKSYESKGIGLANSKKRLQLLYGSEHKLHISISDETFKIELNIPFKKNELHNS